MQRRKRPASRTGQRFPGKFAGPRSLRCRKNADTKISGIPIYAEPFARKSSEVATAASERQGTKKKMGAHVNHEASTAFAGAWNKRTQPETVGNLTKVDRNASDRCKVCIPKPCVRCRSSLVSVWRPLIAHARFFPQPESSRRAFGYGLPQGRQSRVAQFFRWFAWTRPTLAQSAASGPSQLQAAPEHSHAC